MPLVSLRVTALNTSFAAINRERFTGHYSHGLSLRLAPCAGKKALRGSALTGDIICGQKWYIICEQFVLGTLFVDKKSTLFADDRVWDIICGQKRYIICGQKWYILYERPV
jgi:hypothetical protein